MTSTAIATLNRKVIRTLLSTCLVMAFLAAVPAQAEECFQMVEKSDLQAQTINGKQVFVVSPDAVIPDCNLYQRARDAAQAARQKNQELQATIDELNGRYKELYDAKENYYQLVLRYEGVLNKSSDLVQDFETHSEKWASLQQKYAKLVDDYDKLSESYRSIAKNFSTPLSFEVGGGVTEEEGFAGLIGVSIERITVWGFLQDENNGVMATYNFPWSSL